MSEPSLSYRIKVGTGIGLTVIAGTLIYLKNQPSVSPAAPSVVLKEDLGPVSIPVPSLNEEMQIRPDLREALGKVAGIAPQQRLDLLVAVRGSLSPIECNALLHELLLPRPPTVNEGWNSVYMQNICLILRDQPNVRESFARALSTLVHDPSRDAVVRDYAVQHLRQVWDLARETPSLRSAIEEVFRGLVKGNEPDMAATGLLSLHFLGTRQGEAQPVTLPGNQKQALPPGMGSIESTPTSYSIPDSQIQPLVDGVLKAPASSANVSSRMTALRIVSDRKLAASKPELRAIASDSVKEHALVRMAAIAALGKLADSADRPLLEGLDRSDLRIASAVKTALVSLK